MRLVHRICSTLILVGMLLGGVLPYVATPIASAASIGEVEPNNTAQTAQPLSAIGLENPVQAAISPAADRDWYRFDAVVGRTYVIEVYDVESGLGRAGGNNCVYYNPVGLGLVVYDSTVTEKKRQCPPSAAGNMHNSLEFTADSTGAFYVLVLPHSNAANVFGSYKLRILPKHGEPGAAWDPTTFEPNNKAAIAYELHPGLANTITSTIEQRDAGLSTSFVDIDWYRFDADAGQTYTVELLDVDKRLSADAGNNCVYWNPTGLAMFVFGPTLTAAIAGQCAPSGAGDVHAIAQFTTSTSGTYYIQIYGNANTVGTYGNYKLRILPKHNAPGAAWDATTFEPNNRAVNAYPIEVGRANAISSMIEAPNSSFSTNFSDIDWYRFEAVADQKYVVEVFGAATSLGAQAGNNCVYYNPRGLALFVYSSVLDVPVAGDCNADGSGNTYRIAEFTANTSGTFYIQVYAHNSAVSGSYGLRVLPQYDQAQASWDVALEPNNRWTSAYPLTLNRCDVRSTIEARSAALLTNKADVDYFVVNGVQGKPYTLDVSETAATFGQGGLWVDLYDSTGKLLGRKRSTGSASIDFTAGYTGPYYVGIYPDGNTSGTYKIWVGETLEERCTGVKPPPAIVDGAGSRGTAPDGTLIVIVPPSRDIVSYTIKAECSVSVAQEVTLIVGGRTFAMTSISNALFRTSLNIQSDLPAGRGPFNISTRFTCNGLITINTIGTLTLYDPSGQITDARTGQPIPNAVVTLYRIPGALPDANGQTRDCRTVATRGAAGWEGLPPASLSAGVAVNPLTDALNGTQQVNPQVNPQLTGNDGRYAWDVVEGCWFVTVEAPGYRMAVSPLVGVPQAVTDLNIALSAAQHLLYLPSIFR